jgi:uncharacterized protein (TIGR02145 family)
MENHMNSLKLVLLTASLVLATAFTFSCSFLDEDPEDNIWGDFSYGELPYGGKTYRTIVIGTQTWMAENLNHEVDGSLCYGNNSANCTKYGRLYDWQTANTVCPSDWRLPSNEDWNILIDYVGGRASAGKYLKAKSGWNDYREKSGGGENKYGFTALPGGHGSPSDDHHFVGAGAFGNWWSSRGNGGGLNDHLYMTYSDETAIISSSGASYKHSVRCIKD